MNRRDHEQTVSRLHARVGWGSIVLAALLSAQCASSGVDVAPTTPEPSSPGASADTTTAGPDALPAGPGRAVLLSACTSCHDLGGIRRLAGYYDRGDWLEVVDTMEAQGAILLTGQKDVLVDYLAEHFGPRKD